MSNITEHRQSWIERFIQEQSLPIATDWNAMNSESEYFLYHSLREMEKTLERMKVNINPVIPDNVIHVNFNQSKG